MKKLVKIFNLKKDRRRLPRQRRMVVYYRDGGKCRYCGRKVYYSNYHADHVKPVVRRNGKYGGNDYVFNLVTSCSKCNLSRSNNERIQPRRIPLWRKLYQFVLIVVFMDFPSIDDFT